jgi:hypothetical protein
MQTSKQAKHIIQMHQHRPVTQLWLAMLCAVICRSVKSQFFYKPRNIDDRHHCWNNQNFGLNSGRPTETLAIALTLAMLLPLCSLPAPVIA